MNSAQSHNHKAIEFLLKTLEETMIQAKAQGSALRLLCMGRNWQATVTDFSKQTAPQLRPLFDQLRSSMLSNQSEISESQPLPEDWKEIVRGLVDSAS